MVVVSKAVLKARMLEYFRRVEESGEPLIVTSHRKPVLRVEPIGEDGLLPGAFADLRGGARGTGSEIPPRRQGECVMEGAAQPRHRLRLGRLRGTMRLNSDITVPLGAEDWDAAR